MGLACPGPPLFKKFIIIIFYIRTTAGGAPIFTCSDQEYADFSASHLISCIGVFVGLLGQRRFPLAKKTWDYSGDEN